MSEANLKQSGRKASACTMLWSGKAYTPKEAKEAQAAKAKYAKAA